VDGLPFDRDGFLPIDNHARVRGHVDIYAAGDGANFPLKQGGIACQQADAAAQHIAREAGIPVKAEPFRPVLRGKLLTGGRPHYLVHDFSGSTTVVEKTSAHILWWPPTKVAGSYLAPYLTGREQETVAVAPEATDEVELRGYEFAAR
jgi:sulfide:quinone oxidoreductase